MKINKEGNKIILVSLFISAAVIAACFVWLPQWAAWAVAGLSAVKISFLMLFFREPARPLLHDDSLVYSPADGKVVAVEEVHEKEYLDEKRIQVSVFMSITNVHINWFPVGGEIAYFKYHPGKFMVAWHPKSSELNERTTTVVDTGKHMILFRQIAGFVARRIVSYAKEGKDAGQNAKCGFIKFGSRVDVMLPPESEILVKIGDKVTGSQSPIARLKA